MTKINLKEAHSYTTLKMLYFSEPDFYKVIASQKPDMVIGSSLGAFTALNCKGIPVIAINPCILT